MRRPVGLAGRRRHATTPHAANDPPTRRKATSHAGGGLRPENAGTRAPTSAAIITPQRRIQTHGGCREAGARMGRAYSPRVRLTEP